MEEEPHPFQFLEKFKGCQAKGLNKSPLTVSSCENELYELVCFTYFHLAWTSHISCWPNVLGDSAQLQLTS